MFGLSFTEIVIIAVLALILLGPDKLPEAARTAGKLMRELRRATDDIKDQLETEIYADDLKRRPTAVPPVASSVARPAGAPPAEAMSIEAAPAELPPSFVGPTAPPDGAGMQAAPAPAVPNEPVASVLKP
jgi:sec-independent protein translocase protein TatB